MPYFVIKNVNIFTKFSILSQAAKFDSLGITTCKEKNRNIPILKILFTNICINNCKYCYNRVKNDIRRAIFTPEEIAKLTFELYKKGVIKGLFLSSGIFRSADDTMERMIKGIEILRKKYEFKGYIHLKILPGTSEELIKKAINLADRVSCNIELPTQKSLKFWAPEKDKAELIKTLCKIKKLQLEKEVPLSASTQLIIGASSDKDKTILKLAEDLYKNRLVKRVYYSAYIPVNKDPDLPDIKNPPYLREYRLYQADWLMRYYGFTLEELFFNKENLDLNLDPKLSWALSHPEFFPVDIAKADYWELVRVPGIGPQVAKKIIKLRKESIINEESLKKLGLSLEKIKNFITIKGRPLRRILYKSNDFKATQLTLENFYGIF
jgi:putative DNA modification/repair radical SAM protein